MPNIETKNDSDQRRENDHHDIEKTPHLPDLEDVLPEERAPLPMQTTQVTFLDFAGQSMYYAFHQIFLSPKTWLWI